MDRKFAQLIKDLLYGDNKQKLAIEGFTLNHENNSLLNHESFSKIVKKQIREITIVNENKIS